MAKTWTINVQVNTLYVANLRGKGDWKNPIASHQYWRNNVRMTAVSDDPSDGIQVGTGDDFSLTVGAGDIIKWITSEVNPMYRNHRSICMYGFKQGENWREHLTDPNTVNHEAGFVAITHGFNDDDEPRKKYIKTSTADISVAQTEVRAHASSASIRYYMKLLLVDTSSLKDPKVLKYLQVDPIIKIVR